MADPTVMSARLAAFLAVAEPAATDIEVTSYEVMTGGYSRLLARAEVTWLIPVRRVRPHVDCMRVEPSAALERVP